MLRSRTVLLVWRLVAVYAAVLCFCGASAWAYVLDSFSTSGAWNVQAFGGGTMMWADMPNPWHYIDSPGSYRIWFKTAGSDYKRGGVQCDRVCPVPNLTGYDKLSFHIRGEGTYTGQAVDLRVSLYLYDETHNAWLRTDEVQVPFTWAKYEFNRGTAAVGPSGDFINGSNGANFHWDDVKTIRFVIQERSANYLTNVDAHIYIDLLEATGFTLPSPLVDDFNSPTSAWNASASSGARCLLVEGGNAWHSAEGGRSMRAWLTCDASDNQRGSVTLERVGTWNFSTFDRIGLYGMSWSHERVRPSGLRLKLLVGNASKNAWLQSAEVPLPDDRFGRIEFSRTSGFTDAGGGSAFSWSDVTNIKIVVLESSSTNEVPVDAEVYLDLFNAAAAPDPRWRVLYDTGSPGEMAFRGPPVYVGYRSGSAGIGFEQCRSAVPFRVSQDCVIREVWASWFRSPEDLRNQVGQGVGTLVNYAIFSRSGSGTPGNEVSTGILGPYDQSRDEDARVPGNFNVYKYRDLQIPLAKGDYYMSVFATRQDGSPIYLNWYTGGGLQDEALEWSAARGQVGMWRAFNLSAAGFTAFSNQDISAPGLDPDDAYNPCITLLGTISDVAVVSVADAKGLEDGTLVRLTQPVACSTSSDTFADGSFYVQDLNRTSGIKVVPSSGLSVNLSEGDLVTPTGFLRTNSAQERYIEALAIN